MKAIIRAMHDGHFIEIVYISKSGDAEKTREALERFRKDSMFDYYVTTIAEHAIHE